ncbi:YheC/YheD family endospore coat-associated protein [Fuchsiella alkaliacetigena]|uniref:YheC/YheD family endospore coat-associated protein n=1 Tax=Fuchsiella alkaliacetigena TaxID=957042 RepID=UPI002009FEAC|nr:YheC/YheD family protein [Fuchsiella alkaliacetigena]MCK8824179.1 YheC/YheD family protein [Fuchsiella alkaliacetigena]
MLIGIYTAEINPLKVMPKERSYCLAAEAKMQGCEVIFFEKEGVNYTNRIITGIIREDGEWVEKKFSLPDVLIDEHLTLIKDLKLDKNIPEVEFLKNEVPLLRFGLHNKAKMYDKLNKSEKFAKYIPPYDIIEEPAKVKKYVEKYGCIVLKPIDGAQGKGIGFLEDKGDWILVKQHTKINEFKKEEFSRFAEMMADGTYLIQPYLECRTKLGYPFDFRVHVQRDGKGEWGITKIYPRIGTQKSILSNVSRGGMISNIDYFLVTEYAEKAEIIKDILSQLALELTDHVDGFYNYSLDELGIDLAIDKNENIWLYEVNAGPQTKHHEWERARNTIAYARYIAKKQEVRKLLEKLWKMSNKIKKGLKFLLQDSKENNAFDDNLLSKINQGFNSIKTQLEPRYIYFEDSKLEELTSVLDNQLFALQKEVNQNFENISDVFKNYNDWQQKFKENLFQLKQEAVNEDKD